MEPNAYKSGRHWCRGSVAVGTFARESEKERARKGGRQREEKILCFIDVQQDPGPVTNLGLPCLPVQPDCAFTLPVTVTRATGAALDPPLWTVVPINSLSLSLSLWGGWD